MSRFAVYSVSVSGKYPFTFGSVVSGSTQAKRLCRNKKYHEATLNAICYSAEEKELCIAKRTNKGYVAIAFITVQQDRRFYRHVSMKVPEEIIESNNLIATLLETRALTQVA